MPDQDLTQRYEQLVLESGDIDALSQLLQLSRARIERVISFRLDTRLRARIDPEDIVQEAWVEASRRIDDFRQCGHRLPFFLWLRFLALQKLNEFRRHHLGVKFRDANREVGLYQFGSASMTSEVLAAQLLGKNTSPSYAAIREENRVRLEQALTEIDEMDQEILALRHFEQLNNRETAQLLNIQESAASNRYFRAVIRLRKIMTRINNGTSGIFHDS